MCTSGHKCSQAHPDQSLAQYLLKGMTARFRIGYNWSRERKSASSNLPSASTHPEVVQQNLDQEVASGRPPGPFQPDELCPPIHVSRFGIIEKKHQQGKFRIIIDMSFPEGKSVYDGIATKLCSLSYTRVDDLVKGICKLGSGALMAKIDIKVPIVLCRFTQ